MFTVTIKAITIDISTGAITAYSMVTIASTTNTTTTKI